MWWVRCDRGVTARSAAKEVACLAPDYPIAAYVARRVRADVGEEYGEPRIWPTEHGTEQYYEVTLREGATLR
jgi:orotate phosphoribosyltransferase